MLSQARHGRGEAYASYLGPTGYRGRIFYGFGRARFSEGMDFGFAMLLVNERLSTGARAVDDNEVDGYLIDTATDSDRTFAGVNAEHFAYSSGAGFIQVISPVDYAD